MSTWIMDGWTFEWLPRYRAACSQQPQLSLLSNNPQCSSSQSTVPFLSFNTLVLDDTRIWIIIVYVTRVTAYTIYWNYCGCDLYIYKLLTEKNLVCDDDARSARGTEPLVIMSFVFLLLPKFQNWTQPTMACAIQFRACHVMTSYGSSGVMTK